MVFLGRSGVGEGWKGKNTNNWSIYICIFIYLFNVFVYLTRKLYVNIVHTYSFAMLIVLHAMFLGRAVTNAGRTCSPTPLLVLIMYRGNKICFYHRCFIMLKTALFPYRNILGVL